MDEVQEGAIAGDFIPESPAPEIITEEEDDTSFDFTVCFAGDINLDENWCTTQYMSAQPNGIYDCISEELVGFMKDADIMCLNNEFSYSIQGEPLAGKAYTFRANPERVEVLQQLGVDAVTLANNHVYDYGKEALMLTPIAYRAWNITTGNRSYIVLEIIGSMKRHWILCFCCFIFRETIEKHS